MEIRWESAAKIAAGVLLAAAIVISLPSLLASDQPGPLEPDIGLPQPPPPAPLPDPALEARAAARQRVLAKRRRRRAEKRRHKRLAAQRENREQEELESEASGSPAPPYTPPVAAPAPPSRQEFGFERG